MGVDSFSPQRGPGAELLVRGQSPHKLNETYQYTGQSLPNYKTILLGISKFYKIHLLNVQTQHYNHLYSPIMVEQ